MTLGELRAVVLGPTGRAHSRYPILSVCLCAGLGSSATVCLLLPFLMWSERDLYLSVALLGISSAIAFSSSYQLVPYFPDSANIALTAGAHHTALSQDCCMHQASLLPYQCKPSRSLRLWCLARIRWRWTCGVVAPVGWQDWASCLILAGVLALRGFSRADNAGYASSLTPAWCCFENMCSHGLICLQHV